MIHLKEGLQTVAPVSLSFRNLISSLSYWNPLSLSFLCVIAVDFTAMTQRFFSIGNKWH